jgi:hypothetical protein
MEEEKKKLEEEIQIKKLEEEKKIKNNSNHSNKLKQSSYKKTC